MKRQGCSNCIWASWVIFQKKYAQATPAPLLTLLCKEHAWLEEGRGEFIGNTAEENKPQPHPSHQGGHSAGWGWGLVWDFFFFWSYFSLVTAEAMVENSAKGSSSKHVPVDDAERVSSFFSPNDSRKNHGSTAPGRHGGGTAQVRQEKSDNIGGMAWARATETRDWGQTDT